MNTLFAAPLLQRDDNAPRSRKDEAKIRITEAGMQPVALSKARHRSVTDMAFGVWVGLWRRTQTWSRRASACA